MKMRRTYHTNDNHIHAGEFNRWVMSAEGVKRIFSDTTPDFTHHRLYRFKDATIEFYQQGSWKDETALPVEITIEGDTPKTVEEICAKLEKSFHF